MRRFRPAALVPLVLFMAVQGCADPKKDKVLAVVDGDPITETEFKREAEQQPPYVRPILETPRGKEQFLDRMITLDLLMREAVRRGIERRPDVRDRLDQARKAVVLEALLREVAEKAPGLSEEALRKHYDANPDKFRAGERVKVSHVLFKDRETAAGCASRARAGEPFDGLIKEAMAAGGTGADLGYVERGSFVKEFEDAAFAAPENSIAGPVKTIYGFHVIKVGGKRPAGVQSFEDVKTRIAADLREGAQRDAFEGLVADLKKRARIEVRFRSPLPPPDLGSPLQEGAGAEGKGGEAPPGGAAAPGGPPAGTPTPPGGR